MGSTAATFTIPFQKGQNARFKVYLFVVRRTSQDQKNLRGTAPSSPEFSGTKRGGRDDFGT